MCSRRPGGHEILVFAPRGTGESSPPNSPEGYRTDGYVADLESLRKHLDIDRLTLYGNSYGGTVVLAYACAHPDRVARFVVTTHPPEWMRTSSRRQRTRAGGSRRQPRTGQSDSPHRIRQTPRSMRIRARPTPSGRFERRWDAAWLVRGPAEVAYSDRLCSAPDNRQAVAGMWTEWNAGLDLLAHAHAATAPALVIAGGADISVPPPASRMVADALPIARYVEFAGVGHFVAVEASDQFRELVAEFLRE